MKSLFSIFTLFCMFLHSVDAPDYELISFDNYNSRVQDNTKYCLIFPNSDWEVNTLEYQPELVVKTINHTPTNKYPSWMELITIREPAFFIQARHKELKGLLFYTHLQVNAIKISKEFQDGITFQTGIRFNQLLGGFNPSGTCFHPSLGTGVWREKLSFNENTVLISVYFGVDDPTLFYDIAESTLQIK